MLRYMTDCIPKPAFSINIDSVNPCMIFPPYV